MKEEFGMNMNDRVILVTGAATGMGRETALELGALGARVVCVTGHNIAGAEDTARAICDAGGEAVAFACDVSEEEQVRAMVAFILERYGRLDGAFNNAGVGPDGVRVPFYSLTELPVSVWEKVMDVNAKGCFLCMKYEIPAMLASGGGSIVNTASVGGLRMAPGFGAYGPSKAAVIAVTRTAAVEYARQGIRVNAVCPGPTLGTDLMKNSMASGSEASAGGDDGPPIPMGKMGQTQDVARAAIWLLSEEAGHITGHALSVDGGMADIG